MTNTTESDSYTGGSSTPLPAYWNDTERFMASLDADAMGPRLSAALRAGGRPCHVLDAKFEPGVQATVLYQLGEDLIRGDLLPHPTSSHQASMTGWPAMALSVYPDDPGLPTLRMATTASVVGPQLAVLSPALTTTQRRALTRRCRVSLLRYRPGRRVTVRLGTPITDGSYVAKVYHDSAKAAAVADEAQALARTAARGGVLRLAPTIGHLPEISVVVQQSICGRPLDALLQAPQGPGTGSMEAVRRAATALAQLHRKSAVSTRLRPVKKELHRFIARAQRISCVEPRLGALLTGLAERLLQTFDAFPLSPLGLVHGDCKPSQFLLAEDGGVFLLDFDHCGLSDQAGDAGTFVASMRQIVVRRIVAGGSPAVSDRYEALAAEFISSYNRSMDDDLTLRIRWHEVIALQRKAVRSFARSPKSPLPAALVEAGHRCLDRVTQALT